MSMQSHLVTEFGQRGFIWSQHDVIALCLPNKALFGTLCQTRAEVAKLCWVMTLGECILGRIEFNYELRVYLLTWNQSVAQGRWKRWLKWMEKYFKRESVSPLIILSNFPLFCVACIIKANMKVNETLCTLLKGHHFHWRKYAPTTASATDVVFVASYESDTIKWVNARWMTQAMTDGCMR